MAAEYAYPNRPSRPRRSVVTEETIEIIKRRNASTHDRAWIYRLIKLANVRSIFKGWSHKWKYVAWSVARGFVRPGMMARMKALTKAKQALFHEVSKSVENDWNSLVIKQEQMLVNAVSCGDVRTLQTFITETKPKIRRPQFALERDDGIVCVDESECQ